MTYTLHISIPGLPKTPNARMHWAERMKETKKWRTSVVAACLDQRPSTPLTRAHVTFIRYSTHRLDHDNLVASMKAHLDGLQCAGIIVNDNYATIGVPDYLWIKSTRKDARVEIIVRTKQ